MVRRKILVVEDHPLNLELVTAVLEGAGHTVLEAKDGIGLPQRVQAELPDLILMDLQLPGIDGLTLIRQLKADPATRGIPILVMTAYSDPDTQAQALKAGCAGYFSKPLNLEQLVQTIALLLGELAPVCTKDGVCALPPSGS